MSVKREVTLDELKKELKKEKEKKKLHLALRETLTLLLFIVATAILLAVYAFPVLQIYGSSMSPSLEDGQMVVCLKTSNIKQGDLVSFYYNNKMLVKRLIAFPGDWVDIDDKGNVYVNNELLDEPYIEQKSVGDSDIEFPYQVPQGKYFVIGDNRNVSIDSRNSTIGDISQDQIVGKIIFRIYPFTKIGNVN